MKVFIGIITKLDNYQLNQDNLVKKVKIKKYLQK